MPSRRERPKPSREKSRTAIPWIVDSKSSARLATVRQTNTNLELKLQGLLKELGFEFEVGNRDLPGSPDVANRSERWAVFAHGCFWHSHARCRFATIPRRNREAWISKFEANAARDRRALARLRRQGYRAVVVWGCQLLSDPEKVRRRLERLLTAPRKDAARAHSANSNGGLLRSS